MQISERHLLFTKRVVEADQEHSFYYLLVLDQCMQYPTSAKKKKEVTRTINIYASNQYAQSENTLTMCHLMDHTS